MDAETRKIITEMLDDPKLEVQFFRGMKQTDNKKDSSANYAPTGGKTVVISVGGGANNVRIERIKTEDDE